MGDPSAGTSGGGLPRSKEKVVISTVIALSLVGIFPEFFRGCAERAKRCFDIKRLRSCRTGISIAGIGMERLKFYDFEGYTPGVRYDNGHYFVAIVDDGLALLEKSSTPEESVVTLGFEDPFAYVLRRKPALGGSPWLESGDNFPKTHMPDPDLVFGNADLTMLPNYPNSNEKSDMEMAEAYRPIFRQHLPLSQLSMVVALPPKKDTAFAGHTISPPLHMRDLPRRSEHSGVPLPHGSGQAEENEFFAAR